MKQVIHVCPNGCNALLETTAHVVQSWKVDAQGRFVDVLSTDETTHGPDDDNCWFCMECGTEAEVLNCTVQAYIPEEEDACEYRVFRPDSDHAHAYWAVIGMSETHKAEIVRDSKSGEAYIMAFGVRIPLLF